jgi:cytochrome d ubiquinol oxidase subunit II
VTPADLLGAAMLASLVLYALLGGADFGGGIWDLLASGPRRDAQRDLISHALGPVWEANHVWLILVIVVLFTAFPSAFAAVSIELFVPLVLLLFGIVGRTTACRRAGGSCSRCRRCSPRSSWAWRSAPSPPGA